MLPKIYNIAFFSKQIVRNWSHLPKKLLIENIIFRAVQMCIKVHLLLVWYSSRLPIASTYVITVMWNVLAIFDSLTAILVNLDAFVMRFHCSTYALQWKLETEIPNSSSSKSLRTDFIKRNFVWIFPKSPATFTKRNYEALQDNVM